MTLIYLIWAHFIADCVLQTERQAKLKHSSWRHLLTHCFVYSGTVGIFLMYRGVYSDWKFFALFGSHLLIDKYLSSAKDVQKIGPVGYVDQALHILILLVLFLWG